MADKRSEYVVEINGVEHAFLLTEEDAANIEGAKKKSGAAKDIAEAQSKQVQAANKSLAASTK